MGIGPIIAGIVGIGMLVGTVVVVAPRFIEDKGETASASKEIIQNDTATLTGEITNVTALEQKVASMQAQLTQLQTQVNTLPTTKTVVQQTSQTQSKLPPQFIPLGASSNTPNGVTTWQTLPTPIVTINSASYPGYVSMQLQMNLLVFQGNGTAYAQLVDVNSGVVVPFSQVSATNYDYTFVSSSTFQLFPGVHTYGLQVMTTTGYPVQFSDARIQVNFF